MNALQSYSSDDESTEEFATKKMNKLADSGTNYDDVGMDISEDSGDNAETENEDDPKGESFSSNSKLSSSVRSESSEIPDNHRKGSSSSLHSFKESEKKDSLEKNRGSNSSSDKAKDDRHSVSGSKRERSRERSSVSSRDQRESRDHKESRRTLDLKEHRKGGRSDERRSGRRSRSRSRDRRRSRSRSRSRDRDRRRKKSRSKSRSRSRSRSRDRDRERERDKDRDNRDRDRRRPHEIRKEAQQKLAAFKASNPDFDHNELLKRGMEAQFAEVQKNTGVTLPSYYNPATMNPLKIAEQERKKKLLWGNKQSKVDTAVMPDYSGGSNADLWVNTTFSNDADGKMAEKFKRLMGVKAMGAASSIPTNPVSAAGASNKDNSEILQKQESMFSSMEKQYEMARLATHTHKGFGLGFTSQTYLPKP